MGVKSMSSPRSAEGSRGNIYVFATLLGPFLDPFRSRLGTLFRRRCEPQTDVTSRARLGAISGPNRSRPGAPEMGNTEANSMSPFSFPERSQTALKAEIGPKTASSESSF